MGSSKSINDSELFRQFGLEANCKFNDLAISRSCQQYGYNSDSSSKFSE